LTVCGVEVWGSLLGNKTKKADGKDHKKLKLTTSSESGVSPTWPWKAKKLVDGQDKPQPDIRDRKTHTCTHSDSIPGNWQSVGFDEAKVSKVKLMGRTDCC
jgi:hypothetical protein